MKRVLDDDEVWIKDKDVYKKVKAHFHVENESSLNIGKTSERSELVSNTKQASIRTIPKVSTRKAKLDDVPFPILKTIFSYIKFEGSNWLYTRLVCKKWNTAGFEVWNPQSVNALIRSLQRPAVTEEYAIRLWKDSRVYGNDADIILLLACEARYKKLFEIIFHDEAIILELDTVMYPDDILSLAIKSGIFLMVFLLYNRGLRFNERHYWIAIAFMNSEPKHPRDGRTIFEFVHKFYCPEEEGVSKNMKVTIIEWAIKQGDLDVFMKIVNRENMKYGEGEFKKAFELRKEDLYDKTSLLNVLLKTSYAKYISRNFDPFEVNKEYERSSSTKPLHHLGEER